MTSKSVVNLEKRIEAKARHVAHSRTLRDYRENYSDWQRLEERYYRKHGQYYLLRNTDSTAHRSCGRR